MNTVENTTETLLTVTLTKELVAYSTYPGNFFVNSKKKLR